MYGWTRKEIVSFWSVSGLPITIDGYGKAYAQSPDPGSTVSQDSSVTVYLREYEVKAEQIDQEDAENAE